MSRVATPTRTDVRFDGDSAAVNYVGEATMGSLSSSPVWRIKRIAYTGGSLVLKWADGNDSYDNIWDNRAALTYP